MNATDPALTNASRYGKIYLKDDEIDYEYKDKNIAEFRRFANTRQELEDWNDGELYRESRGPGIDQDKVNAPSDCVFIRVCCSADPIEGEYEFYNDVKYFGVETFPTLTAALKDIDLFSVVYDGSEFKLSDVTGQQRCGIENKDVATYEITWDGNLHYFIKCQFIGDREKLITSVLNYQKNSTAYFDASYRKKAYQNAIKSGIEIVDLRLTKETA